MKTYRETINYLFSCLPMYQRIGKAAYKSDLGNIQKLDAYFHHPHKKFKTVHVGGTNGKGSVSSLPLRPPACVYARSLLPPGSPVSPWACNSPLSPTLSTKQLCSYSFSNFYGIILWFWHLLYCISMRRALILFSCMKWQIISSVSPHIASAVLRSGTRGNLSLTFTLFIQNIIQLVLCLHQLIARHH